MPRRMKTRKSNIKIVNKKVITAIILLLFLMLFSVAFSLINMGNNKIAIGVKIGNINVSNLTRRRSKTKDRKMV